MGKKWSKKRMSGMKSYVYYIELKNYFFMMQTAQKRDHYITNRIFTVKLNLLNLLDTLLDNLLESSFNIII